MNARTLTAILLLAAAASAPAQLDTTNPKPLHSGGSGPADLSGYTTTLPEAAVTAHAAALAGSAEFTGAFQAFSAELDSLATGDGTGLTSLAEAAVTAHAAALASDAAFTAAYMETGDYDSTPGDGVVNGADSATESLFAASLTGAFDNDIDGAGYSLTGLTHLGSDTYGALVEYVEGANQTLPDANYILRDPGASAKTDTVSYSTGEPNVRTVKNASMNPGSTLTLANEIGSTIVVIPANSAATIFYRPTNQVESTTIAGDPTADGDITVVVTAAGMTGSPITLDVAILDADTLAQAVTKVRAAMSGNANLSAWFTVGGTGAEIVLTRKAAADDDPTMNIAVTGELGITGDTTSDNTIRGIYTWLY